jgi:hypothetical protein
VSELKPRSPRLKSRKSNRKNASCEAFFFVPAPFTRSLVGRWHRLDIRWSCYGVFIASACSENCTGRETQLFVIQITM